MLVRAPVAQAPILMAPAIKAAAPTRTDLVAPGVATTASSLVVAAVRNRLYEIDVPE